MNQVTTIIITAVLSSLFTISLGFFLIQRFWRENAEKTTQKYLERLKEEMGPVIEERVKKGVKRGVKEGVRDGISSMASGDVIRETTRSMAKTGVDIVGETLKPLLSRRTTRHSRYRDENRDD
ncbi:MAG: hypothetical protein COA99_08245 [Moraxellaceae bacterium]|nr:MAG: hypothetical protein COA99_08245 [Moraxellaceae bacterium]